MKNMNMILKKILRLELGIMSICGFILFFNACQNSKDKMLDQRTLHPKKMALEMHDMRRIKTSDIEETINYQLTHTKNSYLSLLISQPDEENPFSGFSISAVIIGAKEKVIIPPNKHRYSIVVLKGHGVLYGDKTAYVLKPATTLVVGMGVDKIKLVNTTKKSLSLLVYAQPACTADYLDQFYQLARIKYKDLVQDIKVDSNRQLDKSDESFQDETFPKGSGIIPGKVETQVKKLEVLKKHEKQAPTYKNPEQEARLIDKQINLGVENKEQQEELKDEIKREIGAQVKAKIEKLDEDNVDSKKVSKDVKTEKRKDEDDNLDSKKIADEILDEKSDKVEESELDAKEAEEKKSEDEKLIEDKADKVNESELDVQKSEENKKLVDDNKLEVDKVDSEKINN